MRKLTHEEFMEKVSSSFKERYIFLTEYNGDINYIKLLDVDGRIYLTSPTHIKEGKYCRKSSALNKKEIFLKEANAKHNFKFEYNLDNYILQKSIIEIKCPKHGWYKQSVQNHLKGCECIKCNLRTFIQLQGFTQETFLSKCNKTHKNKYDYSLVNYNTMHKPITIICPIHGKFVQNARTHYDGGNCPKCAKEISGAGFTKTKWIELGEKSTKFDSFKVYIIECWNDSEKFIKIGRTFNKTTARFKGGSNTALPYNFKIIKEIVGSGSYIYDLENKLHRKFTQNHYTPKIHFEGDSECFNIDIKNKLYSINI